MKDTASKNAQKILNEYASSLVQEKGNVARVTTYCYDNFAQGVRAIMPDVDEETIDKMYSASGFTTAKYRDFIHLAWYEQADAFNTVALIIDCVLANMHQNTAPLSLTDVMAASDIKACYDSSDWADRRFSAHETRTDCKRAMDALVYAGRFSKMAVKTCGKVHIYLYTPIV